MFFKKKYKGTGANLDTRSIIDRQKDYKFEEIVASANPVIWVEKTQDQWRKFPIFDQNGSNSCVAQSVAKLLGILYWLSNNQYIQFSATHLYMRRANKPSGGMAGSDALTLARQGITLEDLVPSQALTDDQMDTTIIPQYKVDVGKIFKINNYIVLPTKDIEIIASTIQTTKKGVMVWFYWKFDEWTNTPQIIYPNLLETDSGVGKHSVVAVDFALVNGKKCLIIEDSWGSQFGYKGQRVISEDFFKVRNIYAAYPLTFAFLDTSTPSSDKPQYKFTKILTLSPKFSVDQDVMALQNILKYEGLFALNIDSTGYFGSITASSVLKFKQKYKLSGDGNTVDQLMINKLNSLYS